MPTVNEELLDRLISHSVWLERFKTSTQNEIIELLLTEELPPVLEGIGSSLGSVSTGKPRGIKDSKRLRNMRRRYTAQLAAAYGRLHAAFQEDLDDVAAYEAEFSVRLLDDVMPTELGISFSRPSERILESIVRSRPVVGRIVREHFSVIGDRTADAITRRINEGLVAGESTDSIVRGIRGTRAARFTDGILRGAAVSPTESAVRTSIGEVANSAREATAAANPDLVQSMQWVATLDHRTCPICSPRDSKTYPVGEGYRPPAHPRCRCTMIFVVPSLSTLGRRLGLDLSDVSGQTRASLTGDVPERTTHLDWIKRQPAAAQREWLGPARYRLWKEQGVTPDRFNDRTGRPLNLREISRREGVPIPERRRRRPVRS